MKKGEIVIINSIFGGEIRLPKMKGEDLYKVLTAKSEISSIVEEIQKKAEELLSRYAPLAPEVWADAARDYSRKLQAYEAALTTHAAARQALQEKMGQVQNEIREISGLRPFKGLR